MKGKHELLRASSSEKLKLWEKTLAINSEKVNAFSFFSL